MKLNISKELIERCVLNDQSSQTKLYEITYNLFQRFIKKFIKDNDDDVDDILSLSYTRIYKKLELYNYKSSFESWCYVIIKHAISDFYAKKTLDTINVSELESRYHSKQVENGKLDFFDFYDYGEQVNNLGEDTLLMDDYLAIIRSVLSDREFLVFKYFCDGYTHKEIADMLSISEGTSKWFVHEIRVKIQKNNTFKNLTK